MAEALDPELRRCGRFVYSLNNSLGKGTFAEVFLGHDDGGGPVAIKRISRTRLKKASAQRLLDSEIAIMKKLQHPNVILLLDVLETSDEICLVMEYCDGGDLAEYIKNHAGMKEHVIASIANQLSAALTYLRQLNIVHRDLKPHNVLLKHHEDGTFTLKLADFGFARQLVEDEMAATFCGSPLYMAPEVLHGAKYSAKAELWSVGTILYSCLTGHTPYKATSMAALRQLLRKPNLKLDIPAHASPALAHLLLRLLQISPKKRCDFEEFARHRFLTGQDLSSDELQATNIASIDSPDPDPSLFEEDDSDSSSSSYVMVDDIQVQLNIMTDAAQGAHFEPSQPPSDLVSRFTSRWYPGSAAKSSPSGADPKLQQFARTVSDLLQPATAIIDFAESRYPDLAASSTVPIDPQAITKDHCHALLLYAKTLQLFRAGVRSMRHAVQEHPQWMRDPKVKHLIDQLRRQFSTCIRASERLRDAGVARASAQMRHLQTAEQLLYEKGLILCRVAAEDEKEHHLKSSAKYYSQAIVLLKVVLEAAPDKDREVLGKYIQSAEDRRKLVIAQLDSGSSAATDTSAKAAESSPDSMLNSLAIRQEVQAAQAVDIDAQRAPVPTLLQNSPEMYRRGMAYGSSPPDAGYPYMMPGMSPPYPSGHPAHPGTQPQYLTAQHHDMYNPNILGLSPPNQSAYGYMPMQHYPHPNMYPHQGSFPPHPGHVYGYPPSYPPPGPHPSHPTSHSTHSNPAASVMECPYCQQRVVPSRFCSHCGEALMSSLNDSATSAPFPASLSHDPTPQGARTPQGPPSPDDNLPLDDVTPKGSPERKVPLNSL